MFTNQNKLTSNSYFMKLALLQAKQNLGNTHENPSVGCVIVKNNNVISVGKTSLGGRPHAEYNAIKNSKKNLKNSNIYITLEPCSHYGKTPPCTDLIINKKIKKVFISINDTDLRSKGKSSLFLKKKGLKLKNGIFSKKINSFYRSYIKSKTSLLPFVTCKLAVTRDFFTTNKKNKWITNKYSRGRVHLMRQDHDCVLTSSSTILKDNSKLTCRINGLYKKSPARIILDRNLKISLKSNIILEGKRHTTIIFYNKLNSKKINKLKKLRIKLFKISIDLNGDLNLHDVLIKAKELGFNRIFLEAGIKLSNSFFHNNLIDDLNLFISNKKIGTNGSNNIKKQLNFFLKNKKSIVEKVNLLGDKLIKYKIK